MRAPTGWPARSPLIPNRRVGAVDRARYAYESALRGSPGELQIQLVARPRNQNIKKGFQRFWKPFIVRAIQDPSRLSARQLYSASSMSTYSYTQTTHSLRTVDLPAPVVKRLLAYREQYRPKKGDFIFRNESGTPIDPDNWFTSVFVPTAIKAKSRSSTAPDDDGQQVGLHTLRHTYASLLINQGESIKYVSKQLGQTSGDHGRRDGSMTVKARGFTAGSSISGGSTLTRVAASSIESSAPRSMWSRCASRA
jgi:hypothetical protein